MPLSVENLNSIREETDITIYGEPLHLTYNPQGLTPELERRIADAMDGSYKSEALIFMLKTMLIDWDLEENVPLLDADGHQVLVDGEPQFETDAEGVVQVRPFGTSDEKMQTLPVKFLADVTQALAEEIRKAGEGGKASGGS